MIYTCKVCKSTDVQTIEWIKPNTENSFVVEIAKGDPYSDGHDPRYNWCNECDMHRSLQVSTPEEYLVLMGGSRCGLNADWCVQSWHFGPCGIPNTDQWDYYILDLEDDDNPEAFELVQRFYIPGDNDEIDTLAQGSAETMVATVRALLKTRKARQ